MMRCLDLKTEVMDVPGFGFVTYKAEAILYVGTVESDF